MTNVLEDMKVLDLYAGSYIKQGCYIDLEEDGKIYGGDGAVCLSDTQPNRYKVLLKFPDKDIEAWDCDIFEYKGTFALLHLSKTIWEITVPEGHELGDVNISFDNHIDYVEFLNKLERKCSIYDKEALDHLPEDVVSKLKEMV